jgi:hypothetical protein
MPGLVKIGQTTNTPEQRAKELGASTGTPTPFAVAHFEGVPDCVATEKRVHRRLFEQRINPKREFFEMSVADAISIVRELASEDRRNSEAAAFDDAAATRTYQLDSSDEDAHGTQAWATSRDQRQVISPRSDSRERPRPRRLGKVVALFGGVAIIAVIVAGIDPQQSSPGTGGDAGSTRTTAAGSAQCVVEALHCERFNGERRSGRDRHALVSTAEDAHRHADALCLLQSNLASSDKWLVGASNYEASRAWDGLGCRGRAVEAVEAALKRPHDRSWQATCWQCWQLNADCTSCGPRPSQVDAVVDPYSAGAR